MSDTTKTYLEMTPAERGAEKTRLKQWYGWHADEFLKIIQELEGALDERRKDKR